MVDQFDMLEERELFVVALLVRDTPFATLTDRIAGVVDCALQCGGDVQSFDNSIVLITFGLARTQGKDPKNDCQRFIDTLSRTMGRDVSGVFGPRRALVGSVGSDRRKSYTFLFEGYRDFLGQLIDTPLGSIRQV